MTEQPGLAPDSERQDLYSGRRIEWRWVFVGALIVLGLETLLGSSFAAFGGKLESLGVFLVGGTIAFLVGGFMIGWLSPGWTVWEAAFASAIAVAWTIFLVARLLEAQFLSTLPPSLAWSLVCGLAGGWIGERLQHRR
jgi:hypothetical protein